MFWKTICWIAGFSYKETCNFLFRFHRIKITVRHLNHLQWKCNLQRRGNHSNINTVIKFIQDELKGSSFCFGYRYMLQKLQSSGLTSYKETVRLKLKSMDPVGVDMRTRGTHLHVVNIFILSKSYVAYLWLWKTETIWDSYTWSYR